MRKSASGAVAGATLVLLGLAATPALAASSFDFNMVRTEGLPNECAERARASVHVDTTPGFTERLVVNVRGFRPGTPLVLFAIQVPNAPFGIGWYEGDVAIGARGAVTETFVSRFNDETFAVAVGTAPAPQPHTGDGATNPIFRPVHTYHLGIWFDSVAAAVANGCPAVMTPFNGDHTAGPQVLNTGTFPDKFGPLRHVN